MRNKIISIGIFIAVCIVIYFIVYNYTSQINIKNRNNTFESTGNDVNYRDEYVQKYVQTLVNSNFSEGFAMLSEDSKNSFNNDLKRYTEQIVNATRILNRTQGGIEINLINEFNMKKYNKLEYDIISKSYDYIQNNEKYFADQFSVFKEFYLIEYSPNVFKIEIQLY